MNTRETHCNAGYCSIDVKHNPEHSLTVMEIIFDDKRGSVGLPNIVSEKGDDERRNSKVDCEETSPPPPPSVCP